jgi:branched-chain amino acid transport system substrate-binding protein
MANERGGRQTRSDRTAGPPNRRARLGAVAAIGAALAVALAGCSTSASPTPSAAGSTPAAPSAAAPSTAESPSAAMGRTIKIGYVSPQTGALAPFAEADDYIINGVKQAIGAGVVNNGVTYPIEIIEKDSQSDPNRAAEVANELILDDAVDMIVVASTPETTNPVTDACEANGIPCISTVAPWQPWLLRDPNVAPPDTKPFQWSYHFFWGLEDIISVYQDMWSQVDNNKTVGFLMPNDGDGQAWSSTTVGFPTALDPAGWTIIDPGRYENGSQDFTSQINAFKKGNVEVLTGVPIPPDFTTFWTQAAQQGFKPKAASIGKALLFPAAVEALGPDLGVGLSSEVWWSPSHPFKSSLTNASAKDLADGYTAATGKQWTQPIGFVHALFEVAADALSRASSVDDKAAVRDAIKATNLDTVVGHIAWDGTGLPPFAAANVAKTPLVGGQWVKGSGNFPYELVIVSNKDHPEIPAGGTMQPIPGS